MSQPFELPATPTDIPMIDFGRDGKVLFQLPVLGAKGVPMGITSAFAQFNSVVHGRNGKKASDDAFSAAWSYFISVLADNYPDATRYLSTLDDEGLKAAITHWGEASKEHNYDPKA
ncbi:hypothetical protein GCM10022198_00180 [Klugiella xanthotipulae]|uniref:Uncharacterized protein n=1 Tax=Klugiella xanthotipulae TaxID=244735 RepID=A0A543I5M3_9MICO|nr:hypothetical protein [Klugiella xanthotipulae]TQM65841.1 hypothetical protein FB466_0655 [Klugiella xanthotipulae]